MMSPREALQILDATVQQIPGTRADHARLVDAIRTLDEVIPPQTESAPKEKQ